MRIYLIPGLGFDQQVFSKLDLEQEDIQYLNWIEPLEDESIKSYAKRLGQNIPNDGVKTILIGHSLGGIISQEIASFKSIDQIILISSIKSRQELPVFFKLIKPLHLYHLFRKGWTLSTVKFWGKKQDYVTKEEQALFKDMVGKQSNHYLQWALKTLSAWQGIEVPSTTQIIQISGALDKTFPIKLIDKPNYTIEDGAHFMVYRKASILNKIIHSAL
jgi:predicted alpha/beta hydrolase family esterase